MNNSIVWRALACLTLIISFNTALGASTFPGSWSVSSASLSKYSFKPGDSVTVTITYKCTSYGYVYYPLDLEKTNEAYALTCGAPNQHDHYCANKAVVRRFYSSTCDGNYRTDSFSYTIPSTTKYGDYSVYLGWWIGSYSSTIESWVGSAYLGRIIIGCIQSECDKNDYTYCKGNELWKMDYYCSGPDCVSTTYGLMSCAYGCENSYLGTKCKSPPPPPPTNPYCGDGKCNGAESCATCQTDCGTCCPNGCDDSNPCTTDYCNGVAGCVHEVITPCAGNGVCEAGEHYCNAPSDCSFSCGTCQLINCDYGTPVCTYLSNCCGNGVCEAGEDCNSCARDCGCALSIDLSSVTCSINGLPCSQAVIKDSDVITAGFQLRTQSNQGISNVLVTFKRNGVTIGSFTTNSAYVSYSFTLPEGRQNVQVTAYDARYSQSDDKTLFSIYVNGADATESKVNFINPFNPNEGESSEGGGGVIPGAFNGFNSLFVLYYLISAFGIYGLIMFDRMYNNDSYFRSLISKAGSNLWSFFSGVASAVWEFIKIKPIIERYHDTYVPVQDIKVIIQDTQPNVITTMDDPLFNNVIHYNTGAVIGNSVSNSAKVVMGLSGLGAIIGVVLLFTPAAPVGGAILALSGKAFTAGVAGWAGGELIYFGSRGIEAELLNLEDEYSTQDSGRLAQDALQAGAMAGSYLVGKALQKPINNFISSQIQKNYFKRLIEITYTDDKMIINHNGVTTIARLNEKKSFLIDGVKVVVYGDKGIILNYDLYGKKVECLFNLVDSDTPALLIPAHGTNNYVLVKYDTTSWSNTLRSYNTPIIAHETLGETAVNLGVMDINKLNGVKLPQGLSYVDYMQGLVPDVIASKYVGIESVINSRISVGDPNWWIKYPGIVSQVESLIPNTFNPGLLSNYFIEGMSGLSTVINNTLPR